jgi:hypothetical protein
MVTTYSAPPPFNFYSIALQFTKLAILQFPPASYSVPFLDQNNFFRTCFQTSSHFTTTGKVSHPYKTTRKVILFYTLIVIFLQQTRKPLQSILQPLLQPNENRRLKRNWPADLRN